MVLFILPDNILENQICDNCHKYLSAKPVMLAWRKIVCGRCINDEEDLTESHYNILSEHTLFKCINRFDGCTELLAPEQVIDHEVSCESQSYTCLICTQIIPSYLFPYHVKNHHKATYLSENCFAVKPDDFQINVFFYQKENALFFITQKYCTEENLISLNAVCISGPQLNVFQKYYLEKPQHLVETCRRKCHHISDAHKCDEIDYFKIKKSQDNQLVNIRFEFEITNDIQFMKFDPIFSNCYSKNIPLKQVLKREILRSMRMCETGTCKFSRNLDLSKVNNQTMPFITLDGSRTKLIIEICDDNSSSQFISVCSHCILCKHGPLSAHETYVTKTGTLRHFICRFCQKYISNFLIHFKLLKLNLNQFKNIQYSCIKKCKNIFMNDYSKHYEENCKLFDRKPCCMSNCDFVAESVSLLTNHFQAKHNETLIICTGFYIYTTELFKEIGKRYILFFDTLINVNLTNDDGAYWFSGEICDKERLTDSNLVIALYQNGHFPISSSQFKIVLNNKVKINPTTINLLHIILTH